MKKTEIKEKDMNSREGFSLIELIIAIAVLAIMVGIISLSTALLRSADTRGLANKINDSLTDLKSMSEAHTGPYYLHLYRVDDDGYYRLFDSSASFSEPATKESSDRLGPDSMAIVVNGGASGVLGDDIDSVTIRINKKDGSYFGGAPTSFDIKKGKDDSSPVDYKVILAEKTGLHYVD